MVKIGFFGASAGNITEGTVIKNETNLSGFGNSTSEGTLIQQNITLNNEFLLVCFACRFYNNTGSDQTFTLRLYRDTTLLKTINYTVPTATHKYAIVQYLDNKLSGSYTYKSTGQISIASTSAKIYYGAMALIPLTG